MVGLEDTKLLQASVRTRIRVKCFFGGVALTRQHALQETLSIPIGTWPEKHFGVPIFQGRTTRACTGVVLDKIRSKIITWKAFMRKKFRKADGELVTGSKPSSIWPGINKALKLLTPQTTWVIDKICFHLPLSCQISFLEKQYPGKLTWYVVITCIIAGFGGMLFGYDLGISGEWSTSMPPFLKKFFPDVYRKEEGIVSTNQYCMFDSQILTLFTSSLYLAALVGSCFASYVTRKYGRKVSMVCGGVCFCIGAGLTGFVVHILMLIIGRLSLGVGVGFANQAIPLFLSEMAPCQHRGKLNNIFQLMITIGICLANLVNYETNTIKGGWGWRLSLGLAVVPACALIIGSFFVLDTPRSMIDRGKNDEAKETLTRIRGTINVDEEYKDMVAESKSMDNEQSWKAIFSRKYRPQLVMALAIPFFQQFTGINVIMFYAPVLFRTIGLGKNASLMSALITGAVNVAATFIAIFTVDKYGRKLLFITGGVVMLFCEIVIGSIIAYKFGWNGLGKITYSFASLLVFLICIYVVGFSFSWGPLGWLVPSEIFPMEVRSTLQCLTVVMNMSITFIIGQVFLSALCQARYGLFYIFAIFVVTMTLFVYFFLPETKGIPIDEMSKVWKRHWFWKRYFPNDGGNRRVDGI
ncbi:hypothetical protein IFM89_028898 [Coptis chinensis]|uniref:Major facilitator superfamily (MFS) profile domain-containing protein n=1 Tax=Coptis chinensis TaxID=261450 RepID=A0A835H6P1_9MAGN|nr:hypothetical protein IFM89_028898 [Coptis chinensis]